MALALSVSKTFHRYYDPIDPVYTLTGYGSYAKWYIKDELYKSVVDGSLTYTGKNRRRLLKVEGRDLVLSTFSANANISNSSNNFSKASAAAYDGRSATGIASGNCSIEGVPNQKTIAITLQSTLATYDFTSSPLIGNSMVFLADKTGMIIENAVVREYFQYTLGDKGFIELVDGIINYWLISSTGEMTKIRSARSALTYPIYPSIVLYSTGSTLDSVRVWEGSVATQELQYFSVLKNFQDWNNQAQYESLAERTVTKDKSEKFTYFSSDKNLLTLSLNLEWRDEDEYFDFLDFFKYHDLSKEFIFEDFARKKFSQEDAQYYFMRFTAAFKDSPLGTGIFGIQCEARKLLASDLSFLHKVALSRLDLRPPSNPGNFLFSNSGSGAALADWDASTDAEFAIDYYELLITLSS